MAKTPRPEPAPGLLVVDKQAGWTSHDVVAKARGILATKKVGHAGTLDPMATGVLVLGVGKATRLLTFVVGADKDYTATIRLGQTTITDDAEGEVVVEVDASSVTDAQIMEAVRSLTGNISQVPSSVSAIKIDGKRSYARVRGGEDVVIPARPVTVSRFEVLDVRRAGTMVDVDVEATVSSGTYIRALARDVGAGTGVGGHITALRRTRVGPFGLAEARTLDQIQAIADAGEKPGSISLADAAARTMPSIEVSDEHREELRHGRGIPLNASAATFDGKAAAISVAGTLVAIVEARGEVLRPVIVFDGIEGSRP